MSHDIARYRQGYSIGAGALVRADDRILLVRIGYGPYQGAWLLPGGYVEPGETADLTVRREVLEETGITTEVLGLVAARSRVLPDENSIYLVFLLRALADSPHPDGVEVLDARFFSRAGLDALPGITHMTRLLATRALEGTLRVLDRTPIPDYVEAEFALFF